MGRIHLVWQCCGKEEIKQFGSVAVKKKPKEEIKQFGSVAVKKKLNSLAVLR